MSQVVIDDPFLPGTRSTMRNPASGPLSGLTFAVKDLIDVEGLVTGGGNPDWASEQVSASRNAICVDRMIGAGASFAGKTITDELAFSLEGENAHFGTPRNPCASDRIPGGSSSGSAVAVASHLTDTALGTDTGGSVRVPAAFCGIAGFRPSHGRIPLDGVIPFAPSLDTVGWFARGPELLAAVGEVLLDTWRGEAPHRFLIATDVFSLCDPACAKALHTVARRFDPISTSIMGDPLPWRDAYRALQGREIRDSLGAWISRRKPRFGETIAPRFADVFTISDEEFARAASFRHAQRARLDTLVEDGSVLIVPTVPGFPLSLDASGEERGLFYDLALAMNAIAGFGGYPQLTIPLAQLDGLPLSLSFIAGRNADEALLGLAGTMEDNS